MFMMHHIEKHELTPKIHMIVVRAHNKMHACLTSHFILRVGLRFKVLGLSLGLGLKLC